MTNDTPQIIAAFVGAGAIGLGLVSLLVILTFAFSRVAMIEEKISRPGTSALEHRKVWGNDPLGRLMRSSYVFTFLVLRSLPSNRLKRSAAQIGDVSTRLPVRLSLWGLLPPLCLFGCFIVVLITGLFL
ncbi:hypothetical protein [Marinobacter sp. HL-58]|uniref:hypothetical protein n=1 Tax=Marinobacter sp. HL-58 TaxID=1479237 RepID=UPI0006D9928A|nr:hypothetical protein [Marinobacter sp. HL-58]KPQ00108.1 MAG: hypothetical protein HLUCCO03_17330 [Marinobacter sp. HL-58]